jgi:hypothetical protein
MEGRVSNEIYAMNLRRVPWRELGDLERAGGLPSSDSYWWEFVRDTYVATQAMAIRRQVDQGRRVESLGRLLREIVDHPGAITRKFWLEQWDTDDPHEIEIAEEQWDEHYAGPNREYLDPAIPAADLESLETATAAATEYADKNVAHVDKNPGNPATYKDLDDAIDAISRTLQRYYPLFTAASTATTPVIQGDWKAAWRTPWLRS